MSELITLIAAWDSAVWEFSLVFEGLADEDLWTRAHPRLLSVGELTGHVGYYEALDATGWGGGAGENPPMIESILANPDFKYYTSEVDKPVILDIGAEALIAELKRVHEEAKAKIEKLQLDLDAQVGEAEWPKWRDWLQYRSFHAAYHTGQAYSVRHLMGHTTTDN